MTETTNKNRNITGSTYSVQKEELKEFINDFKDEEGNEKYRNLIDEIIQGKSNTLNIEVDDIDKYNFRTQLKFDIVNNTLRYIKILNEIVDEMIPESLDVSTSFGAFAAQRIAVRQESGSDKPFPPELHRRFTIYIIPPTDFIKSGAHKGQKIVLPLREVRADCIGKLVKVRGLVTRITKAKPLISIATYSCSQCSEETFQTVTTPTFVPKHVCESQQCRSAARPGTLMLQTRRSKFQRFQVIRLQELSSEVPTGHIPRSMTVYARESLVDTCSTGSVVQISGIYLPLPIKAVNQSLVSETYLEAQEIKVTKEFVYNEDPEDERVSNVNVYDSLSSTIAPEIFGHEDLKKCILLQLVGGVARKFDGGVRIRGDINICLMGDPGVAKSQLLKWVSNVSERAVYTTGRGSSGVGLTAAVLKDPVTGEMALEGGSLVLADEGICCIDEFDKMDESDRTAIYEVMEQQTISISKAGITTTLNARTSILAAANPVDSRYNTKKSLLENVNLPAALLSRFDLLFLLLDSPKVESDTNLANHIAHVHQQGKPPESENYSLNYLRDYIRHAKQIEPIIPPQLEKYLTAAYVEMRNEKTDEPITPRYLLATIRLSMALARLRFSTEVNQEDIVEALRLVRASRDSVEGADQKDIKADVSHLIFDKIRKLWRGMRVINMSEIKRGLLESGFTEAQIERALNDYEKLNAIQINPSRTRITFVEMP